jgi:hypothetical protein
MALVGHLGFDPKNNFENLSVCRVDLYMIFFILERKKQHYAAEVFKVIYYFLVVNGQVSCTILGLRLKGKN